MSYDKIIKRLIDSEEINYGIIFGNEKIVFIKTGAGGNIRGYKDKYLKMAHRIHQRIGATVICSSNPDVSHRSVDKSIISEVAAVRKFPEYKVYFVGTSDGAYQTLVLAKDVPQTVKVLGINTSPITVDDLKEKLQGIPHIKKLLVYGSEDDEYGCVSLLRELKCDNLEIITVDGADHQFTGMLEEFIALSDLL